MADKVSSKRQLKLVAQFVDGDTRTFTFENPKNTLSSDTINNAATVLANTQVFIGDKAGAAFLDFGTKALVSEEHKTVLDLNL